MKITHIFWALIGAFLLTVASISWLPSASTFPQLRDYMIYTMFASWAVFFSLGIVLTVLIVKNKMEKKLKIFLLLTGASAVGFVVFAVLHNVFYGLEMMTTNIILDKFMEVLHVISFLISIPICLPIGFMVGVIGSIVLFWKRRKREKKSKR